MGKNLKKLKQNKGMSLVEVVVSVAVSFIVFIGAISFIATSTNFFKRQESTIDLQNELMESSNKIHDTLMEASDFQIFNLADGGMFMYTAAPDNSKDIFTTGKGSGRRIEWSKKNSTLYVLDTPKEVSKRSTEDSIAYLIGNHVTNVQITNMDECIIPQPGGSVKYSQPLMLEVHIEVSDGNETRSDTKTVTLRNEFEHIVLYGTYYVNEGGGILVKK